MKTVEDVLNSVTSCIVCKKSLRVKNAFYSIDDGPNNSIQAVCSKECFNKKENR